MPRTSTPPPRTRASRRPEIASAWLRRNQPKPKKSPAKHAFSTLAGALPGRRSAPLPPPRRGGKKRGLALLAGAAGLAFKNRDKLTALVQRNKPAAPKSSPDASATSG